MKFIEKLNLKPQFEGHPTVTKKYLVKKCGSYNPAHYKKYWLDEHFARYYINHNATGLALYEATKEELEQLRLNHKVELVTKSISDYFSTTSKICLLTDFEEDKYEYYSVTQTTKKVGSWCTVRVAK